MAQFLQIAGELLALLHGCAGFSEPRLLPCLRFQRGEFSQMRQQQILIRLRLIQRGPRLIQLVARIAPFGPALLHLRHIRPGKPIQQSPMAARIHQAAIIMLPMQLHKRSCHFAQQAHTDGLIIDIGLALAIGLQLAAQDQRLAIFHINISIIEQFGQTGGKRGKFKTGGNAGLILAPAHQPAVGPIAQHQPQRIQQNGFARPGFTREHAQPAPEIEIKRFDQHDVTNGEAGQHHGHP